MRTARLGCKRRPHGCGTADARAHTQTMIARMVSVLVGERGRRSAARSWMRSGRRSRASLLAGCGTAATRVHAKAMRLAGFTQNCHTDRHDGSTALSFFTSLLRIHPTVEPPVATPAAEGEKEQQVELDRRRGFDARIFAHPSIHAGYNAHLLHHDGSNLLHYCRVQNP